jgi:hypothetical protein
MINNAHRGYSKSPNVKAGEPLLVVKFSDEDIQELQRQVLKQKIDELFEEPSTYEDDEDDDDGDLLVRR